MELKKMFKLSAVSAALSATLLLAGCGGDINIDTGSQEPTNPTNPTDPTTPTETDQQLAYGGFAEKSTTIAAIDGKEVWVLTGTLAPSTAASTVKVGGQDGANIILGNDVVWMLDGAVIAGGDKADSVELSIMAGTKIIGGSESYLVISRDSKIMAEGTADAPIVFTSLEAALGQTGEAGQWGGLVVLGNAPVNSCPDLTSCDAAFEVGNHNYGGDNTEDNSGVIQYVRVEFGGFKINDTQEMNGISFAAVGAGTTVDHIQIHKNNDDGVEFWGGNVSLSHVVLTENFDDSLDWTNGWQGSAQHVYIRQEDNGSNRGIEGDSNSSADAEPQSMPTLANFTIEVANGTNSGGDDAEGILLRKGTAVNAYNMLVKGDVDSGECLEINDDNTVDTAEAGNLNMQNSLIDCVEPFKSAKVDADKGYTKAYDVEAWFMAQEGNLAGAADLSGYMPNSSSVALTGGAADLANMDDRLDDAQYIGAFNGSTDWTEGWTTAIHEDAAPAPTELPVLTSCPVGTTSEDVVAGLYKDDSVTLVCSIEGNITTNTTLLAGQNVMYKVDGGAVIVGGDNADSATLAIQAGTQLFATDNSYIAISRGSKIMAQGSAEHPIVMTSQQDVIAGAEGERGQWGGLVILGNGETNKCPDKDNCDVSFEVGDFPYGGNDNADNSGQISYVVVKYAGFKVNDTQEMNGISFAAVGSGTQVDHIQVHANGDDGVEFWGGAVNLKYVYLTDNFDDSLDWTNGWQGKAQYVYITHEDGQANRGIEGDSHKGTDDTPISNPTISNVTILPGADIENASGDKGEGIILRVATRASIHNLLIQGRKGATSETESGECLELDGTYAGLVTNVNDETLVMSHSVIDCNEPFKYSSDNTDTTDAVDTQAWFLAQTGNSAQEVTLTNGMPAGTDTVLLGTGLDMSTTDTFFESTDYIGAFDGQTDWREGWAFIK
ncbi:MULTISPECIES: hypothetical protein [unclassified Shewanella]|uniref:hypothetical protein n=1 Tax=unclassified Shewanella TaxID=196818 RepID=UPI000C8210A0|nr:MULTISPECIES: hypothetical protein [unclassified Shewanella]PMH88237.1 hypothetical protein BCU57_04105 [Shewanella sp. 10N.286.48.B5]PMI02537.1 hypothetical protein BCU55_06575 [Shewanella sp. 10N.286.48.A6]